ncbi:MAG: hypothetical protein EPO61_12610 [Nitrospirae bacterium]|nr:MAG: hypothetical protein EPO61_12610 [Nitrospirota bacterium]
MRNPRIWAMWAAHHEQQGLDPHDALEVVMLWELGRDGHDEALRELVRRFQVMVAPRLRVVVDQIERMLQDTGI